jgi:hypothetical protein
MATWERLVSDSSWRDPDEQDARNNSMLTDVLKEEEALGGQVDLDRSERTLCGRPCWFQTPNHPIRMTQLDFTGKPRRASDGIFRPELLTSVQQTDDSGLATFHFVLSAG